MVMVDGQHPTIGRFRFPADGTASTLGREPRLVFRERDSEVALKLLVTVAPSAGSCETVGGEGVAMKAFYGVPDEAAPTLFASQLISDALVLRHSKRGKRAPFCALLVVPTAQLFGQVGAPAVSEGTQLSSVASSPHLCRANITRGQPARVVRRAPAARLGRPTAVAYGAVWGVGLASSVPLLSLLHFAEPA
jgi:hypothetical protein